MFAHTSRFAFSSKRKILESGNDENLDSAEWVKSFQLAKKWGFPVEKIRHASCVTPTLSPKSRQGQNAKNPFPYLSDVKEEDILSAWLFDGPETNQIVKLSGAEALEFVHFLSTEMKPLGPIVPAFPWLKRHKHGVARWSVDMTIKGSTGLLASWADCPAIMVERNYWGMQEREWRRGHQLAEQLKQKKPQ
jgi:hypothetical protein